MQDFRYITDSPLFCVADAVLLPFLSGTGRLAVAAARAAHRALCVRAETRVASVLGIPAPADIRAVWTPPRRPLRQALVIGSRLVDLSPAHPSARKWAAPDAHGRRRLAGRDGGLKGYFATHLRDIPYPTAMKYRRLALRVRRFLGLPAQIPLESLLAAGVPDALAADAALVDALFAARRRLWEVLAEVRSQRELGRFLDRRLDTDRLPLGLGSGDSAQEAAIRDELLRRGEKRIAEAVASGRPLNRDEKRARRLLARLRKIAALFERS